MCSSDLAAGFGLCAVFILLVGTVPMGAVLLVLAMGVAGFLSGIIMPSRDMMVREAAPPGAEGRVFGIVSTGFNIAGAIGPVLFGWIMDQGRPQWIFGASVLLMSITVLIAFAQERSLATRGKRA